MLGEWEIPLGPTFYPLALKIRSWEERLEKVTDNELLFY